MKFALLVTWFERSPIVRSYQGEDIGIVREYNPNNRMSETDALNKLGEKGYDIYDMQHGMDGEIPTTTFRLKAKAE